MTKSDILVEMSDLLQFSIHRILMTEGLGVALNYSRDLLVLKRGEYLGADRLSFSPSWLVNLATKFDPDRQQILTGYATCLSTSILVHLLACIAQLPNELIIGVWVDSGKLHSHAWVEFGDGRRADLGNQAGSYKEICRISIKDLGRL